MVNSLTLLSSKVKFVSFLFRPIYRNHYPGTMEQRDIPADFDCCIADCPFSQRHLDDSKCNNDREYNHSNGPKEVRQNAVQVYVSVALGK